jgi:hypothetical protein
MVYRKAYEVGTVDCVCVCVSFLRKLIQLYLYLMQTEAYDISMDQNGISPTILVDILTTFLVLFIYLYVGNYKLFHKWPTLLLYPSHIFSAI